MHSLSPLWKRVTACLALAWLFAVLNGTLASASGIIRSVPTPQTLNIWNSSEPGYIHAVVLGNPYSFERARMSRELLLGTVLGFDRSSHDHWCRLVIAATVLFAVLVDWSVRLGRGVGLLAQRFWVSELGSGPLPVVCRTKKVVGSADIGCSTFLVLSAGQQRQVLEMALAHMRGYRTDAVRPSADVSFVYEMLRRSECLSICPALRTHCLALVLSASVLALPVEYAAPTELDAITGAVALRAPGSTWTVVRYGYVPTPASSASKLKFGRDSGNTTSAHGSGPRFARASPASRMGAAAPLLFSVISFMLLSCMFAENEVDNRPSGVIEEVPALVDEPDLATKFSSAPVLAVLSPSIVKETGALMRTSTPKVEPATVSSLTAGQREETLNLARTYLRETRTDRLMNDLAHMGLGYRFRCSMYSSADLNTRMGVPLLALTWTIQGQKAVCAANSKFEAGTKASVGAEVERRSSLVRKPVRAPKFAAYVPPALRNGHRMTARDVTAGSSHTAEDRDSQETQDARRGDPQTRFGSLVEQAVVHVEAEEPQYRKTRRGKRAGKPRSERVGAGLEAEVEAGSEL
ncbi:hypothetical protein FRC07_006714 [Ceratobasidium sp. 392]|nr:hypothetical protein FRC07_006714 [Ceratobasidium sp. 392]